MMGLHHAAVWVRMLPTMVGLLVLLGIVAAVAVKMMLQQPASALRPRSASHRPPRR